LREDRVSSLALTEPALSEDLTSLGLSPELAEVISPEEFREETQRAWQSVLRELKGEPPTDEPGPLSPRLRAALLPASSLPGGGRPPLPSPIPTSSAPAVFAGAADAGNAGEGQGEGGFCASGPASSVPSDPAAQQAAGDERFPIYSAAQLSSRRFDTRYLIPGILAAGQPGGIFGAFKTLKTSITADLLISLASGTPFLGHFAVPGAESHAVSLGRIGARRAAVDRQSHLCGPRHRTGGA
jgi:AAA domain